MASLRLSLPFRTKLLLFGGGLALVPVLVLGVRALAITRDGVKTLTRELQVSIVADVSRGVAEQLRAAQDGLDLVGRTLIDDTLDEDVAIAEALRIVSATEALDHVSVYDREGALVDTMREETLAPQRLPEQLDPALRAEASRAGVATGDATGHEEGVRVLLVVPLRVSGTVTGFAASRVTLAPVQARIEALAASRFQGVSDALYVVDEQGRLLAHAELDAATARSEVPSSPLLDSLRRTRGRGVTEASGEIRRPGGGVWVATVAAVPGRPWWVVTQEPAERAYASYFAMRRFVLLTAVAAAVLALVAAYFLSRRITRPIERLAAFADDLAQRRFDRSVVVSTRDELAVLGEAMSRAAHDLASSEKRLLEETQIRNDLGRYLPVELVDKVVRREHDVGLGGERKVVTVLFADVVAFTPLTERLEAEKVVALLNELFTLLTEIVFRHGGTIDKFIGDCVMALWGATESDPEHAARAIRAAEDMLTFLETTNEGWKSRFGASIQLAIGIGSGECIVGNVGSETRMEYTAIGDVVNVASRLESIARPQQILVTEATRVLAGERFTFVDRGAREIPGRAEPLPVFEVIP